MSHPDNRAVTVTDGEFESAVLGSDVPVLVDFWAEWCGPCRVLGPTVEALADDYAGRVKVAKLNIDENPAAAARYGVRSIPTLMLFKNGKPSETAVGLRPKAQLSELIDRHLA
ncbi:MAG: thioredoxin [Pseudomonadota bacterium]